MDRVKMLAAVLPDGIHVNWTVYVDSEAVFCTTIYEDAVSRREFERERIQKQSDQKEFETAN